MDLRKLKTLIELVETSGIAELEMALGELTIEWVPVPDDSPLIGQTLAECGFRAKTGFTVIAIDLPHTLISVEGGKSEVELPSITRMWPTA